MGNHDGLSKIGTGPGNSRIFQQNTNYMHVVPNSHFWTNIAMLQHWLTYAHRLSKQQIIDHLKIGLINTVENGYDIQKLNK